MLNRSDFETKWEQIVVSIVFQRFRSSDVPSGWTICLEWINSQESYYEWKRDNCIEKGFQDHFKDL